MLAAEEEGGIVDCGAGAAGGDWRRSEKTRRDSDMLREAMADADPQEMLRTRCVGRGRQNNAHFPPLPP